MDTSKATNQDFGDDWDRPADAQITVKHLNIYNLAKLLFPSQTDRQSYETAIAWFNLKPHEKTKAVKEIRKQLGGTNG